MTVAVAGTSASRLQGAEAQAVLQVQEMKYRYPARTPPISSIAASAARRAGSAKMANGSMGAAARCSARAKAAMA